MVIMRRVVMPVCRLTQGISGLAVPSVQVLPMQILCARLGSAGPPLLSVRVETLRRVRMDSVEVVEEESVEEQQGLLAVEEEEREGVVGKVAVEAELADDFDLILSSQSDRRRWISIL